MNKELLHNDKNLKIKADALNKCLISLYEKNKSIKLEDNTGELNLKLTIPEINI